MRSRNVEKDQLIGPLCIISAGALHRITRITNILKLGSLHHPASIDIKTGNDSFAEHGG